MQQAERQLLDGVERVLRSVATRTGWFLLVLHLSRIAPPGPRPHHRRVAAAVLDDAAGRSSGQLFGLGNGDMALLFRPSDDGARVSALIARLFQADVPDLQALRSLWPLPAAAAAALDYVRARVADRDPCTAEAAAPPSDRTPIDAVVQGAHPEDLLTRHTGILLRPGTAPHIVPLFRSVHPSAAALEARLAAAGHAAAPFMLDHLSALLGQRMLGLLVDDGLAPPLSGGLGGAALHIGLTIGGILSDAFARFAAHGPALPRPVRVEVPFVEVVSDPKGALLARERLKLAGMPLVVDGLTCSMLLASRPAMLEPHLFKLAWSPAVPADAELRAAIGRCGAERVVLSGCDSEAALNWGRALGIQRFQGRFIDMLLAAERLQSCAHASGCSLAQCRSRAATGSGEPRAACRNPALLDQGLPAPEAP